jgi:PIN domain nuclease of toxin-antitoxin system
VSSVVLDASAVLALLKKEPGGEIVRGKLPGALISAVNLSEVISKHLDWGAALEDVTRALAPLPYRIQPFDTDQAALAASLRPATRAAKFSFADRACLALGLSTGLPVLTGDRKWLEVPTGAEVCLFR